MKEIVQHKIGFDRDAILIQKPLFMHIFHLKKKNSFLSNCLDKRIGHSLYILSSE